MSNGIEYQVYHPALESIIEPVSVTTDLQAEHLVSVLSKTLGGWQIRPVNTGQEPIPPKAPVVSSITVHEARQLMAKHGQDVLVVVAWNGLDGNVNIVTAGSDRQRSEQALALGNDIANGLKLNEGERTEDRRHEHPA